MDIDLWSLMQGMLGGIESDFINSWMAELQSLCSDVIQMAFFIEKTPGLNTSTLSTATVQNALGIMYLLTIGLLVLKLCWKGYKVYVLWRDGEAEVSPLSLLLNSVFALAVALIFPILYEIAVTIVIDVSSSIMNVFPDLHALSTHGATGILEFVWVTLQGHENNGTLSQNLLFVILALIYSFVFVLLIFQMIFRGVQMLIYRLGIPIAVVGLVDSDGGIWKNYIQVFFQQLAVIMIQNFCIRIAAVLIVSVSVTSFVFGIIFLITAFKMPKIFASMLQNGGGGGGQVMYTVMMAARAFTGGA